jgi:hypothetical protein
LLADHLLGGYVEAVPQVDRVAAPALDDDQRHAFASHLHGVRASQLRRREAARTPAATAVLRRSARAAAPDHRRLASGRC